MLVYNYHPVTLEYTGSSEADPDPLDDGCWLIPSSSTLIAPPDPESGKYRIFINDAWAFESIPVEPLAPPVAEETAEKKRINEIISLLDALDLQSIRPLRAIASGTQTAMDTEKLAFLDDQARLLREELALLSGATV